MENYYDILEVSPKASKEIITKAYRTLVKKYHPDANSNSNKPIDDEKIKKINEAYEVLSDEEKRKNYDIELQRIREQESDDMQLRYQKILEQNKVLQQELANLKGRYQENTNYNDNLQHEIDERINQSVNKAYHDAYIQRMRDFGYKIYRKKTLKERAKELLSICLAILVVLIIFFILWQIPDIRNHIESNKIFQSFMNAFIRK